LSTQLSDGDDEFTHRFQQQQTTSHHLLQLAVDPHRVAHQQWQTKRHVAQPAEVSIGRDYMMSMSVESVGNIMMMIIINTFEHRGSHFASSCPQ